MRAEKRYFLWHFKQSVLVDGWIDVRCWYHLTSNSYKRFISYSLMYEVMLFFLRYIVKTSFLINNDFLKFCKISSMILILFTDTLFLLIIDIVQFKLYLYHQVHLEDFHNVQLWNKNIGDEKYQSNVYC